MTTAYPLAWPEGWPRTPAHRRTSNARFSAQFTTARAQLQRELRLLGAKSVVISSWLPLRNDGLPFADAARRRIEDPGVAVYFVLRERPMAMARDIYTNVSDNLRGVGLAIEHMRGLERHGGAHMMERAFTGFQQLPPPGGAARPATRPWREVLAPIPRGLDPADELTIAEVRYREAARTAHTDVGGDGERMIILNAAIAEARAELKP